MLVPTLIIKSNSIDKNLTDLVTETASVTDTAVRRSERNKKKLN